MCRRGADRACVARAREARRERERQARRAAALNQRGAAARVAQVAEPGTGIGKAVAQQGGCHVVAGDAHVREHEIVIGQQFGNLAALAAPVEGLDDEACQTGQSGEERRGGDAAGS